MDTQNLLSDIEKFLSESGMGEYRFGFLSVRNGRLVERLRDAQSRGWRTAKGKTFIIRAETEQEVRAFMAERQKGRAA